MGNRPAHHARRLVPAVVAALAAGCLGSASHAPSKPGSAPSSEAAGRAAWAVHRDRRDALAVTTPPGWTFTVRPVPRLIEPSVPLAVGSGPVPRGGECAPTRAIHVVPRPGVLIWVYEFHRDVKSLDFPVRHRPLRLGKLAGPLECLGVRAYTIRFRIGDRHFQAHVVAHRLGLRLRSQAERVLGSIAVLPD